MVDAYGGAAAAERRRQSSATAGVAAPDTTNDTALWQPPMVGFYTAARHCQQLRRQPAAPREPQLVAAYGRPRRARTSGRVEVGLAGWAPLWVRPETAGPCEGSSGARGGQNGAVVGWAPLYKGWAVTASPTGFRVDLAEDCTITTGLGRAGPARSAPV